MEKKLGGQEQSYIKRQREISKNLTHRQLTAFLETTTATLDLTDFSKCIAYLECPEGSRIASSDFINAKHLCDGIIYIGEEKYNLSEVQIDLLFEHFHDAIQDDLQTWNEMKNDTYNVREDQY